MTGPDPPLPGQKKAPPSDGTLPGEVTQGGKGIASLSARVERYGKARVWTSGMSAYLRQVGENETAARLEQCGHYLKFRHYFTVDRVSLVEASFCEKHQLCQLCALRRASKMVGAYLDRFKYLVGQDNALKASLVTLTVKNGDDLKERFEHLQGGVQTLNQRRKDSKRGKSHKSEWSKVLGQVGSYEITNIGNGWHPHCHIVILHHSSRIDEGLLRQEWWQITGDSYQVDCSPISLSDETALVESFCEVFKYAVKFGSLTFELAYEAWLFLSHRRLVQSSGLFYGVKIPDSLTDEPLEGLPFMEFLYRYVENVGYTCVRQSSEDNCD